MLFGQKTITHESAISIRNLLDTTNSCLKALNNLNIKTQEWDAVIIHLVVLKLDQESHRHWENYLSTITDELPKWSHLEQFLETRFRTLEMIDTNKQSTSFKLHNNQQRNANQVIKPKTFYSDVNVKRSSNEATCAMCNGPHFIYYCTQFKKEPVLERQNIVQSKRLCFNCLAPTHPVFKCQQNSTCRKCGKKHHTLLHFEKEDKQTYQNSRQTESTRDTEHKSSGGINSSSNETTVLANFSRGDVKTYNVLLATAAVKSNSSRNGSSYILRALLDQGSQASFVTEDTVQLLGLKRTNVNGRVSSLGDGHSMVIKYAVNIEVESRNDPGKNIRVYAYVLKSITSILPSREVHIPDWLELKNLPLADPGFASPGKIDVLLGAEVYGEILLNGMKRSPYGNLIAQNTIFGWILSGQVLGGRNV
ncbi:unnamed protein product, partial [Brenthis ino]